MGTQLYQYECEGCGKTVTVAEHPKQHNEDPLWCPSCSAVEVDYTVDPEDYDNPTIIQI